MKHIPWRQIIWVLSALISLLGLAVIFWLVWSLRKGPPRDPGSQIALGFVMYVAMALRGLGLGGMALCLRTEHPHIELALLAHLFFLAAFYVLLMFSGVSIFFPIIGCILATGALGVDLWLLAAVRDIKR